MKRAHNQMKRAHNRMKRAPRQLLCREEISRQNKHVLLTNTHGGKNPFSPTVAKINVCKVIPNQQFARIFSSLDLREMNENK